jgi:hypothetical protein
MEDTRAADRRVSSFVALSFAKGNSSGQRQEQWKEGVRPGTGRDAGRAK